jgi:hypothetical protein
VDIVRGQLGGDGFSNQPTRDEQLSNSAEQFHDFLINSFWLLRDADQVAG